MATLSNFASNTIVPAPAQLKTAMKVIVDTAISRGHVQELGFTVAAARRAIDEIVASRRAHQNNGEENRSTNATTSLLLESPQILASFPRGVEIALVEQTVLNSNLKAKELLQLSEDAAHKRQTGKLEDLSVEGKVGGGKVEVLDSMRAVAFVGIAAKLQKLEPFVPHWHQAIALEAKMENAPHALYSLSEFCDDINYFGERAEARRELLKKVNSGAQRRTGGIVPLNSSPQTGGLSWYLNRGKVAPIYGATMFHMMGEYEDGKRSLFQESSGGDFKESYKLLKWTVEHAWSN